MPSSSKHQSFDSFPRRRQSLRNDRCQNILYKAVFEHFKELKRIATLLLASKSFQNSSFGANFVVNFVIDKDSIRLLQSVLSPSSCFSLQFAPSLHIKQSVFDSEKINQGFSHFVSEFVNAKYFHLSLRSLTLQAVTYEVVSFFFGISSNAWPHLHYLSMSQCGVDETALKMISKNAIQLRTVNFSHNLGITDASLARVSRLSNITSLNLSGCHLITDGGLEHISRLSGITMLNLSYCEQLTDCGLESVSSLSRITLLVLSNCDLFTDVGLEHISKLSGITSLDLLGRQERKQNDRRCGSRIPGCASKLYDQ